jgi:hypothetical protein
MASCCCSFHSSCHLLFTGDLFLWSLMRRCSCSDPGYTVSTASKSGSFVVPFLCVCVCVRALSILSHTTFLRFESEVCARRTGLASDEKIQIMSMASHHDTFRRRPDVSKTSRASVRTTEASGSNSCSRMHLKNLWTMFCGAL